MIYKRPSDFPDGFMARLWHGETPTDEVIKIDGTAPDDDKLSMMREAIQGVMPGAVCLGRSAFDDPKIVETWL